MSQTPNFDKVLDKILATLKPFKKACLQCGLVFDIFAQDIEFYKMLRVPPSSYCPACRAKRRHAFYPRLYDFFKKPCSAPNHTEDVISVYPADSPVKIYDLDFWYSDFWDPCAYQKELIPEKVLEQFKDLALEIPHAAGIRGTRLTDCFYTIGGLDSNNCYYATTPASSEGIYYSFIIVASKDSMDCSDSKNLELCYEVIDSKGCYNCSFLQDCTGCLNSDFLYECHNCSNCFACANLRNKQYHFFNQPLSKDEYFLRRKNYFLGNRKVLQQVKKEFEEKFLKTALRRSLWTQNVITSLGHKIENCNNCYYGFGAYGKENENIRYCEEFQYVKDIMDVSGTSFSSYAYDTAAVIRSSNVKMGFWITNSLEIEYSMFCDNCHHCFACFGLKNKEYCILNKQYQKEEYWHLVDIIKTGLLKQGEYGEFFDPKVFRFYPYNNTMAFLSFPKSKDETKQEGYLWAEREKWSKESNGSDPNVFFTPDGLPEDIKDVRDDILDKVIVCEVSGRPFKFVKRELDFYRKKGLALPTRHPYQRLIDRAQKQEGRYSLYPFLCPKCHKSTHTIYSPEAQSRYNIYCEDCYLKEVI